MGVKFHLKRGFGGGETGNTHRLAEFLTFDPADEAQAETLFAQLPSEIQTEYGSAHRFSGRDRGQENRERASTLERQHVDHLGTRATKNRLRACGSSYHLSIPASEQWRLAARRLARNGGFLP